MDKPFRWDVITVLSIMSEYNIREDADMRNKVLEKEQQGEHDNTLRPTLLKDYVGQDKMKENLRICIESAKIRNKPMDHALFYGPPGLGKTTIAGIIANELGKNMKSITGPAIERPGDLVSALSSLDEGDILFVDEIHRIPCYIEEILYPAMEDFVVDVALGDTGMSGKTIRIDIPKFTLIGATTKAGMLSPPLRSRFGIINKLELYTPEQLADIVRRDAVILGIDITDGALHEIGERSRGTPRIAIRILKRLMDFAVVQSPENPSITEEITAKGLMALGINKSGLDENDINLMSAIHTAFRDGPVGIGTLASFISEDEKTIEDVYEPYLMQKGYIAKKPRGRILTETGIAYITEYFGGNV